MPTPSLILHGGAGNIPDDTLQEHADGCRQAAQIAWDLLSRGGPALDAVEAAVRVLEDDPTFNAGHGACLTRDGDIEMDAILMDGATLNAGAVGAIQRVKNPVAVARLVMERTQHCLLVGAGAEAFARSQGIPVWPTQNLITERRLARWREAQPGGGQRSETSVRETAGHDTVGAVALDVNGHVAVATSTGGIDNKLPGRVGDSPLIGCGAYADDALGAASATGWGESLMKTVISKSACELIAGGATAQQAAEAVIRHLDERVNGRGGIIVVDRQGRVGYAFNTPRMACAWVTPEGSIRAEC
jgi:beta-aspartyl-peptidase (threonine type)